MSTDGTPTDGAPEPVPMEAPEGTGFEWTRQRIVLALIIAAVALAILMLITRPFGCGSSSTQDSQSSNTTPVPAQPAQPTATPQHTLVENLEYIASRFPELQVNFGASTKTFVVDQAVLEDETLEALKARAAEKIKDYDGKTFKEMEIQGSPIVFLNEDGTCVSMFLITIVGTLDDDSAFAPSRIYVSDGSWTPQSSLAFSEQLRQDIDQDPNSLILPTGAGHKIPLRIKVPVYRPVSD